MRRNKVLRRRRHADAGAPVRSCCYSDAAAHLDDPRSLPYSMTGPRSGGAKTLPAWLPSTFHPRASVARRHTRPATRRRAARSRTLPPTSRSWTLPSARAVKFLQLLGRVRQRHFSPPRLARRQKQRRPRAARSPWSFAAAASRLLSQKTAKSDGNQVKSGPPVADWTAAEDPRGGRHNCATAGRRPLLHGRPRLAPTKACRRTTNKVRSRSTTKADVGSPVNSKAKQTAKNLVLVLCFSPPEAWVCDFLFLLLSFAKAYAFPDFAQLKPYVLNSFACHPPILCSGETLCFTDER